MDEAQSKEQCLEEGGLRVSSAEGLRSAVSHLDLVLEEVESCERVWNWQLPQSDLLLERSLWQKWRGVKSQSRELLGGVSNDPGERMMVTLVKLVAVHREVNALLGKSQSLLQQWAPTGLKNIFQIGVHSHPASMSAGEWHDRIHVFWLVSEYKLV